MKTPENQRQAASSADRLDRVQMSASDRARAKAYLHKTEAVFDTLAAVIAAVRAAFGHVPHSAGVAGQPPVQRAWRACPVAG